jgi:hypothetical protein
VATRVPGRHHDVLDAASYVLLPFCRVGTIAGSVLAAAAASICAVCSVPAGVTAAALVPCAHGQSSANIGTRQGCFESNTEGITCGMLPPAFCRRAQPRPDRVLSGCSRVLCVSLATSVPHRRTFVQKRRQNCTCGGWLGELGGLLTYVHA